MIRLTAVCATLAICTLLSGCLESVHPASDSAKAALDPELLGVWRGSFEENNVVYLHVGRGDKGMTQAATVEHRSDGVIKTEHYVAFPTRLGRLGVLNVKAVGGEDKPRGYTLMKYQVAGRTLTLWTLSEDAIREDIKGGKVKGKGEDGPFGDTTITAAIPELAAYLTEADQTRLFNNILMFRRAAEAGR